MVVGAGSIGKRHLRNLKSLGVKRLVVCDPDHTNRDLIGAELQLEERYTDLREAPLQRGDVVFLCSPPHLHTSQALHAAHKGCHLFVEKPLAHELAGTDELVRVVRDQKLVSLGGCNMRFYPAIRKLQELLSAGTIGRVLNFRVEVGIYLPNWRPHLDYRKNYGAHRAQGGGAILDMIHEIDYACWLFGRPQKVFGAWGKFSALDIDTEDAAEILFRYADKLGNVHLDYLAHRYTRTVHAIGDEGDLFWDWHRVGVEQTDRKTKEKIFHRNPEGYELNQMYIDETRYFLDCIAANRESFYPIAEARETLRIAQAAIDAESAGRWMPMNT